MENLEILDPLQFSKEIKKVKEEDFITAATENEIKRKLLNNDVFLKHCIETLKEKLTRAGILTEALEHTSINEAFTFEDLISKKEVTFFTNWTDNIHFPNQTGSGMLIPGFDTRSKMILYSAIPNPTFRQEHHTYIAYVFVAEEGDEVETEVEWKQLMTHDEVSNPNLLINSDFSVNQRDGYIIKTGCKVYNEPALTTDVSNLGLSNKCRRITYKTNTYAAFLGDNGYTYYVNICDIEKGYTGGGSYTVDRWRFNSEEDANILKIQDNYITLMNKKPDKYAEILQLVENCNYYSGKTLTFSAKIRVSEGTKAYLQMNSNNKNHAYSFIGDGEWKIVSTKITLPENVNKFYVGIGIWEGSSGRIDMAWAKLEEGDKATLFVPPLRAEELPRCKYYYQEINYIGNPNVYTPNGLYCNINFSEMRIMPTAYFKNSIFNKIGYVRIGNTGGNLIDGFTFSIRCEPNNEANFNLAIVAEKNNHGLNSTNCNIVIAKNNPICLDGELYLI